MMQNNRLLLLGDSITEWSFDRQGLGAQLAHLYHRRLDVVNRGLAGYNSRWALECFEQWLPPTPTPQEAHTSLATLWLGANDSVLPGNKQHVPLDEFHLNLERIVKILTSPTSRHHDQHAKFILITPPPISPPEWQTERVRRGWTGSIDRTNENTREYADQVIRLGRELQIPVVDAFEATWSAATDEAERTDQEFESVLATYFWDGLHLSAKGYHQVVERVKVVIEHEYPDRHWDRIPMLFPDWNTIRATVAGQLEYIVQGKKNNNM
ncbi:SGNH/GDSL hydrolase family protein [Sporobolomyces koalae]|uniref:SGNH/GDSL hydrolase family protein n=1 Tax=Sporobolomyces koalae TaxID=500713 RepID=UPI00316C8F3E